VKLTKARRNEIFHAIVAAKLHPAVCELVYDATSLRIRHTPTESTFDMTRRKLGGGYFCDLKIGTDPDVEGMVVANWAGVVQVTRYWGKKVAEWENIPDLWELRHSWQSLTDDQYQDSLNIPFTPEEQGIISSQLASIKESIKKAYELTAEQEALIDARFDEAEKAARRLGRKDWILLFSGAVFSLILADAITPDIAHHILTLAVHGMEHLFTTAPRSIRAE
jgi:hypothetical protein